MKQNAIVATVLVLVLAACATVLPSSDPGPSTTRPTSTTVSESPAVDEILVQATMHLLRNDTTFGEGHVFPKVLVVDRMKDGAPLTSDQMAALSTAISKLSEVEFIGDPKDFITDDLRPTIDGAAIITLGPVTIDGSDATIDMEMWCGSLCGIWLTYALEVGDAGWEVLGTVGPIAVS
jgi:hypothetical protein